MKLEDKKRFSVAMYWLAAKYPLGKDTDQNPKPRVLTADWLRDYFEAFKDMPIAKFEAGVKCHYAHNEFFPDKPGSLRKSCDMVPAPRQGWLPAPERILLPETPKSQAKENLQKIAEMLNGMSGSTFFVDDAGALQAGGRKAAAKAE